VNIASLRISGFGNLLSPIYSFYDSSGLKNDFLVGPVTLTEPADVSAAWAAFVSVYKPSISA